MEAADAEGSPNAKLAGVTDGGRNAVTRGDLDGPELLVFQGRHRVRDGSELVNIQELSLLVWVGNFRSDATQSAFVVDTKSPDLSVV